MSGSVGRLESCSAYWLGCALTFLFDCRFWQSLAIAWFVGFFFAFLTVILFLLKRIADHLGVGDDDER